jgi:hypothetical protein
MRLSPTTSASSLRRSMKPPRVARVCSRVHPPTHLLRLPAARYARMAPQRRYRAVYTAASRAVQKELVGFLWTTPTHAANERTLQLTPTSTRVRVVRQKQRPPHLAIFREVSALPFTRLAQPM